MSLDLTNALPIFEINQCVNIHFFLLMKSILSDAQILLMEPRPVIDRPASLRTLVGIVISRGLASSINSKIFKLASHTRRVLVLRAYLV